MQEGNLCRGRAWRAPTYRQINKSLPSWTAPENLRWAWWGWEPLAARHRFGGHKVAFLGDSQWAEQWHERIFSEKTVRRMKALGINFAVTHFFKGLGLRAEHAEILQTREFVSLCHKHGIRVAGYTQFRSLYYETFLKEEPKAAGWIQRRADGSLNTWGGAYYRWAPCVNSREFIGYLKRVITYGAKEIGLDAFHFDNTYAQPCYCARCRGLFREYLKRNLKDVARLGFLGFEHVELPPYHEDYPRVADPLYQEWINFRVEALTAAWRELYLHVKKINPELCMIANPAFPRSCGLANRLSFHPRAAGKFTDLMFAENGNFPCLAGPRHISQIRAFKFGQACGYRVIPTAWKDNENGIRCPVNAREVELSLAEAAAFGGTVGTTWALRTTSGQAVVVDNRELAGPLGEYISFFNRHRDLYAQAVTDAKMAILYSFESFAYRANEASARFIDFEQILLSGHVPYDVLFDEDIGKIGRYRLLVVAGQECLSDKTVSALREFVRRGGKILATGDSGECDERGLAREKNELAAMADGRSVIFDKNAGIGEPVEESSRWLYASAVALPKDAKKVLRAIRELLGKENIPFSVSAPRGVFTNWTKLPDGRRVLHLVNYANEARPVKTRVRFVSGKLAGRKYGVYQPAMNSRVAGRLKGRYSAVNINALITYALIEVGN